jgi:hypothetical protein
MFAIAQTWSGENGILVTGLPSRRERIARGHAALP